MSNTPLRSSTTIFGFALVDQRSYLLSDALGIGEEDPPLQPQDQQARESFILGMFLRAGPEDVGARLASQHVDRRIGRLVRKGHQRSHDGNEDPLQGPQQHHAGKGGQGPEELRSPDLEDSRNSAGLIKPTE